MPPRLGVWLAGGARLCRAGAQRRLGRPQTERRGPTGETWFPPCSRRGPTGETWFPPCSRRGHTGETLVSPVSLWGREDSNLRRLSRRVYSPFPLAARAHPRGAGIVAAGSPRSRDRGSAASAPIGSGAWRAPSRLRSLRWNASTSSSSAPVRPGRPPPFGLRALARRSSCSTVRGFRETSRAAAG